MILNFLIFCVFIIIAAMGFRRGIWLSVLHFATTIASFMIAAQFYQPIAERLELFLPFPKTQAALTKYYIDYSDTHLRFEAIVAFISIFILSKFILYLILTVFDKMTYINRLTLLSRGAGVVLSFLSSIIVLLPVLYMCSLYPSEWIQSQFSHSIIAQLILFHTPYLSSFVMAL
ncbi:CvpA family protein [Staphylococcus carnosus]|uniref:Membrane protein with Colicin_V domain n=1 Tax=Staphylococcus carnosus (strain TM300) TaxID=396513 RepID=B9DPV2_STACT|nr:CvpA family protein [Staphylococcus carnosus]QPT03837.1 CvpA family protein [Staphylococcus carnosus]UQA66562.1 CvpA family protein [Staphylococcus carnosus]UTB78608.1 hypothetical protein A2I62_08600 [Staphylococcus carnosus]UTB88157.1 hypothetical protein A2I63_08590 [Staphylococcus carnosus]UTB90508.1 hypothetical protein A2I64_08595 [Staphylococcus carnosus]